MKIDWLSIVINYRGNPTNLKQGEVCNFEEILYYKLSYIKPLLPELEKGRSGTVLGDNLAPTSPSRMNPEL